MPTLEWSDEFALQPQMDTTHREFVELLAATELALAADRTDLLARFGALLAHTAEHFAQENRWMAATGFAPENCHAFQHDAVLQVMREVDRRARDDGDFGPLERAVAELAAWFPIHAQSMDAALIYHMAQVGFDPVRPDAGVGRTASAEPIAGCGSHACG
jgi:hemerythrin-like metal-binding protein